MEFLSPAGSSRQDEVQREAGRGCLWLLAGLAAWALLAWVWAKLC